MDLPQELLDKILSHLPPYDERDERTLRNCCLVAKSWVHPARRLLFETVELQEKNLQSWLDSIPTTNEGLLQHVRSLSCITNIGNLEYRIDMIQDYFPSLCQLRHLSLSSVHLPLDFSQQVEVFSAFKYTLLRLSLNYCEVTISALVTLISCFPNLNHLDLTHLLRHKMDTKIAPPLSRPRVGKLYIAEFYGDLLGLLDQLSELGLAFDEIVVGGRSGVTTYALSRIVNAMGKTVKRLRLPDYFSGLSPEDGSTILSNCRELRELEMAVSAATIAKTNLISSITSANIQKITFVYSRLWLLPFRRGVEWRNFDDALYRLANRSECKDGLEVDVRVTLYSTHRNFHKRAMEKNILESLAKFRERGRLRIIWERAIVEEDSRFMNS